MKKLALVLAASLFAPGCIIVSDDDDDPVGAGNFDVTWNLLAAEDGSSVGCPPDATTAQVTSVLAGASCPGPDCFIDCFDCSAGGGVTANLPLGDYDVYVDITDAGAGECGVGDPALIAQSAIAEASLVADQDLVGVDFEFTVNGGFLQAAWVLEDQDGELACDEVVNQNGIGVLSTLVGSGGTGFDDKFDCEGDDTCGPQCGTTAALPVGDYDVNVDLLGPDDGELVQCGEDIATSILFGNELVDLGTVVCDLSQ